ncbi:bifunctional diaminohydroxyphosphoribosylaminopyrimidine deaminase/5-amino-6-(5-phosphoribosylamino)uracil reductase RibD [Novipirellula artificiosorum]|uniref:Riboflavin biosynthesis protein RibD n=1 Tax=Novipirellula artificiosorum TaxID=2528016 RepID=A0A5C6D631_9BACT|nr:bifunctional diaminohydroxyphosphoribosylaminopyrimidine deaminase/5-amino-6-(5-phosphoribosylamino)uracil reductase RibD [Novipirellula artificiosorum]TWU31515.1 Riboflavin biosynthesis protein RibD [Novipirellula artificiosorum]
MNDAVLHCESEPSDAEFMRLALQLAEQGRGYVEPNPMVGCVIVRGGKVIGQGFHERFGEAHAEVNALRSCGDPSGATVYVTLEPCCHFGKTPPCTHALIEAGVRRVVVAMGDPFDQVNGGGLTDLQQAGIETVSGVMDAEARELNIAYLKRIQTGRPWCVAKWAMTVDGRIATTIGQSQWITGDESRCDVHQLRGRSDAILVGMGTVLADDPLLTARPAGPRTATRVVFCSRRVPDASSKLIQSARDIPLLLIASESLGDESLNPLEQLGATVFRCGTADPVEGVREAVAHLGSLGMTNVIVEGGGELLGSFVQSGQIDEYHVYMGAKVFGGRTAPGPIGGPGFEQLTDAVALRLIRTAQIGEDVKLVYRGGC